MSKPTSSFLKTKGSLTRFFSFLTFSTAIILFYIFTPNKSLGPSLQSTTLVRKSSLGEDRQDSQLVQRDTNTSSIVQITSPDGANIVVASSNGNLYLQPQSDNSGGSGFDTTTYFYAADDGTVISDYGGRLLQIYSADVAKYGVTRLRLWDPTHLTQNSVLVALVPVVNDATGGSTLVATTSNGQFFYLVACNIHKQNTKIFAVTSPDGVTALASPAMADGITGGVVEQCALINLTDGAAGRAS